MRVLIVDDHAVVRAGTRLLLQETGNGFVCDEAAGCCEALLKVQTNDYDVMLLGLSLPELSGFTTLDRIKRENPLLPVVVLSMHTDTQHAVKTYAMEGDGYVDEANTLGDLVCAIEKVVQGGIFISDHLIKDVLKGLNTGQFDEPVSSEMKQLSQREEQVAELLVCGETLKEIAWQLSLSIKTVSTYKMRILDKLHLKNLVELVKHRTSQASSELPDASRVAPTRHQSG